MHTKKVYKYNNWQYSAQKKWMIQSVILCTRIYYHFHHQIHKQAYSMSVIDAITLRKQQPTRCRQQLSSAKILLYPVQSAKIQQYLVQRNQCRGKNSSTSLHAATGLDTMYQEKYGSAWSMGKNISSLRWL